MPISRLAVAAYTAALLPASIALAAGPVAPVAANQIGCASPVGRGDSAAALIRRFGANASKQKVPGAEGEEMDALVLYPRDPQRRIEVVFSDAKMLRPASVTLRGERSAWVVGGLRLGDGIDQVTQRNGGGFALSGFEWDYGGYVNDLKGGALSQLPGGCTITIRFSLPADLMSTPEVLMGDKTLQSTGPILRRSRPTVSELALSFR